MKESPLGPQWYIVCLGIIWFLHLVGWSQGLDMGMDVSWPVPSMLEMLPVLKSSGWKFHKVE